MKPLVLRMTAFGPYAKEEVIDFNELGESQLFLIHGQTGGGKTTILDAICFALYGDSSGDERKSESFRSDFAPDDLETSVELDFSIGDDAYRVCRKPRQERPKKRGEGTVEANPEGFLYRLDADGNEKKQLAEKISTVTEQIERIIGFHSEQFRQVIVLPQGKFRKLLIASSDEREAILEKLFPTALFKLIQESLKEKASGLRRKQNELRDEQRIRLESKGLESAAQLKESIATAKNGQRDIKPKLTQAKKIEAAATKQFIDAAALAEHFTELSRLNSIMAGLDGRKAEMKSLRKELKAGRSAAGLEDLFSALKSSVEDENKATSSLSDAVSVAEEAVKSLKEAKKAKLEAESRKPNLKKLEHGISDMQKHQLALEPIKMARQALSTAEAEGNSAAETEDEAVRLTGSLSRQIKLNEESIEAFQKKVIDPGKLATEIAAVTAQVATLEKIESATTNLERAESEAGGIEKSQTAAETGYKTAKANLANLRKAWEQGAASRLAEKLVDGSPCAVCGATDHPDPASKADEVPDDSELEEANDAFVRAEEVRDAAKEVLAKAKRVVSADKRAVSTLKKSLDKKEKRTLAELKRLLITQEALQSEQKKIAAEITDLEDAVKNSKTQLTVAEEAKSKAASEASKAKSQLASAKTSLKEKLGAVPEKYLDEDLLQLDLESAEAESAEINGLIESTAAAYVNANSDDAAGKAALTAAQKALDKAKNVLAKKRESWEARRKEAGFASDGDYEDSRLDRDEIEDLESKAKAYEDELANTKTLLKQKTKELGEAKEPDIENLEDKRDSAVTVREELDRQLTQLDVEVKALKQLQKDLAKISGKLVQAEEEYGIVGHLAKIANGDNSKRLSFQRFVLSALLDDVLVAATERLYKMSSGRYRLLRLRDPVDQRSKAGLNLAVEDSHTGKSRPVETLSGGESFQAALSLALGLADVVQSFSGGIRMDTMFVDEGFGSLDSESLDLAMNTLIDLQKGGRMVGVISHVAEMKSCIDVQLVVKSGPEGSSTSFRLP